MATANGCSSILATSDDANSFCGYLCPGEGRSVEAVKFCRNCLQHLCRECLRMHDTINRGKDHTLVDSDHVEETLNDVYIETCDVHSSAIDLYCIRHDALCCRTCVENKHSSCVISYLPLYANGVTESVEFQELVDTLQSSHADLKSLLESREADKNRLTRQTQAIKESFETFRIKWNQHLDELEDDALRVVHNTYTELDNNISLDIDRLQVIIRTMESKLKALSDTTNTRDIQQFINMKKARSVAEDGGKLLEVLAPTVGEETIHFAFNPLLVTALHKCASLGCITRLASEDLYVRLADDELTCRISSMCSLQDGYTILTDHNNFSLKRLNINYEQIESLSFLSRPWGVCEMDQDMLAVSLPMQNMIQIVSIGKRMELKHSFHVGDLCYGLVFQNDELYVTCERDGRGQIKIYTPSGQLRRTIEKNQSGDQLVTVARQVAVSSDGSELYAADEAMGLVIMDKEGALISRVTHQSLESAVSVSVGRKDEVFVAGIDSHNVFRLASDGDTLTQILSECDGIKYPISVHVDTRKNKLMVGMASCDTVRVFQL